MYQLTSYSSLCVQQSEYRDPDYQLLLVGYTRPEEFYYGPEVAHRQVFGYGYLSQEWTRKKPIQNPLYV